MTLSRGSYRVLRKTRYVVRVIHRVGIPDGTHHPNQLVDDVIGDQLRGFTLGQLPLLVPTIFRVVRPGRTRTQRKELAHLTRAVPRALLRALPTRARAIPMGRKPKTRRDTTRVKVRLAIEQTHPFQGRDRPDAIDRLDLFIAMTDAFIRLNKRLHLRFKDLDLLVIEGTLRLPQAPRQGLSLVRFSGAVVALLALELRDRRTLFDQTTTLPLKQANLLNRGVWGMIQGEFVLVTIGVLGQEIGIKGVVFTVVFGLDFLQDRRLLQRADPPPKRQMLQQGVVVASGMFKTQHRRFDGGLVLVEPGEEVLVSRGIVAGLAGGFDEGALGAVPEHDIERVFGDIDPDEVRVVVHGVGVLAWQGYQEHAGELGSIKGLFRAGLGP